MARSIKITKISASMIQPKLYSVVVNLKYMDGDVVLFEKDFSVNYPSGSDPAIAIMNMRKLMQEAINIYKAEQVIFSASEFDTAIIQLQNSLEV